MSQPMDTRMPTATPWVGVTAFAVALLFVIGGFNVIFGFAAVFDDTVWVDSGRGALLLDVSAWGWAHVVLGILCMVVAFGLTRGAIWARAVGSLLVMFNMITQMMALPAYPLWSLLIIALDVLVLWALIVHGNESLEGY
jgi:hypothetical protein